ncbi:TonB-dependent receptor domain-containing protein [Flavobacterium sp.]|uniref:TonB-dependent receptor domain-containing protein n=1 Tax=Flavobacterium sp. TaxID=239 RepID=UPI003D150595
MNKRGVLSLIVLFIFPVFLFAQVEVSGKIVDQNGKTLELMEILMLSSDSTAVKSVHSNSNGEFTLIIDKGEYLFQVKRLGNVLWKEKLNISGDLKIGSIMVNLSENQLSEVIIRSKRKLFETKVDRVVYNISNDAFNKGSNLTDALKRIPRLNVENDVIKIIGKTGNVKFLIDGRIQNLSDEALKAKIRGLRTEQVAKVEIIATPPSRYSAEGNGGMINIILKKDENQGLQGNVNSGAGVQFEKLSTDAGANLNYKLKGLDASLILNHSDSNGSNVNRLTYDFGKSITTTDLTPDFNSKNTALNMVLQYKINSKINIGSTLDFGKRNGQIYSPSTTRYYNNVLQKNDSLLYSKNINYNSNKSQAISIFSDYVLDSIGKKISLIYNYSFNENLSNADNTAKIDNGIELHNSAFTNMGSNRYQINGGLLDFELPFKFGRIETGAAYTDISNSTSIYYYDEQNILDPTRSSQFEYSERTSAAYLSFQRDESKKWGYKLGLRVEDTRTKGFSPTLSITNKNHYSKLFPTLFVSYNPNDTNAINLSYSKRLDRPSFYDLNPFRYYTNPYNYIAGNPQLLPIYTNALEVSYTFKNNLNIIAYGNYITNGLSYLTQINSDNSYVVHPANNFTQKKIGLISSYTWQILKWNSLYIAADCYYTDLVSKKNIQGISGYGGSFSFRNSIQLNKSQTSLLEFDYANYLPSKAQYSDFTSKNQARFGINFKQLFLDNDLVLNLMITDLFRQNIGRSEKQYDTFHYSQYNDVHNKGVYFSLSYNFGNKKVPGIYKDTKNKEKYRVSK